jgi:spore maturation protein CgeD
MPKLLVIVSSFNRPNGLRQAVSSVMQQSLTDLRCVVMDDASTDPGVEEVFRTYERNRRFASVVGLVVSPEDKRDRVCTFSKLINLALDSYDAEYVSYLVDDVVYHPQRCEQLVSYLDKTPEAFACWGQQEFVRVDERGQEVERRMQVPGTPDSIERWAGPTFVERMEQQNFINHCSLVHRRTTLRWSESPAHWRTIDREFWLACGRNGKRFDFLPQVIGERMLSGPHDIGPLLHAGRTIADVAHARGQK